MNSEASKESDISDFFKPPRYMMEVMVKRSAFLRGEKIETKRRPKKTWILLFND